MPTPYRYSVRTIHGAAKLESELDVLSGEGWEPISFQHDAAGNFEVILRQDRNQRLNEVKQLETAVAGAESTRYAVRTIRTLKLESELTGLSNEGWAAISFQHDDAAAAYEVILRQEPKSAARKAPSYRYALRNIHGAAKLENELANLSGEGWELVRLQRDGAGTYEVILRQTISS
jgi:hypothetical protein